MNSIIVYSTNTCPWCTRVKDYLKSRNVSFIEYDVSKDYNKAMEMVDKSGQKGVPVLDINGSIVIGFNPDRINKLLRL
ncbi:glutaredoxin domain-containing protein [Wansuia hejianensis]|uniref:Glutathione S-transferase N-terminal domain-containing protein n=1 Tax=Wansuia hejianensis TaxID=2763667 RepID=A0A926EWJ3_9FIRM|nr:glutaredoxin domain-containing protein [Wansuia hejianensis]MBC8591183.1 glutathione S-transferase N-terminal domain-containing protein [Wansuia hejianensis]